MPSEPSRAPMPGAELLAEPLRSRWSPQVLDPAHELTDHQVTPLLRAAQWAPSCGNLQPWAYVVLRRGTTGHRLLRGRLTRGNADWVPAASVVFVAAARVAEEPDGHGVKSEPVSYYDLGQSAAHLTLQAHAMGLVAHQFQGFDKEGLAADLGLPGHHRFVAAIAIGTPGDPAQATERDREKQRTKVRRRRALSEFVHLDAWGTPWPGDA